MSEAKITWIFVGTIMLALSMVTVTKLAVLIVCLSAVLWAIIRLTALGIKLYAARREARGLKRVNLIGRAESQHQAIMRGDKAKGYYGDYKPKVPAVCIDGIPDPPPTKQELRNAWDCGDVPLLAALAAAPGTLVSGRAPIAFINQWGEAEPIKTIYA